MAGVAVPLSSLRTGRSVGVGQFTDIAALAEWCASVGLELIQLLPLNDGGDATSPYSALSAFALNPIYIDLECIDGSESLRAEIAAEREQGQAEPRLDYARVRLMKLTALRRLYERAAEQRGAERSLQAWMAERPWAAPYAVFMASKEEAGGLPWWEWPSGGRWSATERPSLGSSLGRRALFHAWVQREAERQLSESAAAAEKLGVRLKGDLPILMSRDSADVWSAPEYFDAAYQAGAPPDMFSPDGQNWGFPPYRWDALERDGYRFWRERLSYAGRFYHAVRIDHVLGFLRIWRIPASEHGGTLGHFHPRRLLLRSELRDFFDEGRIAWLSLPHTRGSEIDAALGARSRQAKERLFSKLPREELYRLKPEIDNERAILRLDEPEEVRAFLLARHRDRALLQVDESSFAPSWYYAGTSAVGSLAPQERDRLERLVQACYDESERIWEANGRKLLGMLRESTDMLLCAEDLGAVPDCLPRVLSDLGILSLKIERWARDYKSPGEPLIPPSSYPHLSVCTPSVHDTTPLRAWWEEGGWDRDAYYRLLGGRGPCPASLSSDLCRLVLTRAMRAASLLTIVQFQDYLALTDDLRVPDPADERVNVPGTVAPTNWSYRIPRTIEELRSHDVLTAAVRRVVAARTEAARRDAGEPP